MQRQHQLAKLRRSLQKLTDLLQVCFILALPNCLVWGFVCRFEMLHNANELTTSGPDVDHSWLDVDRSWPDVDRWLWECCRTRMS